MFWLAISTKAAYLCFKDGWATSHSAHSRLYVPILRRHMEDLNSCPHYLEDNATPKKELCGFMLVLSNICLCNKPSKDNLTMSAQETGLQMHILPSWGAAGEVYQPSLWLGPSGLLCSTVLECFSQFFRLNEVGWRGPSISTLQAAKWQEVVNPQLTPWIWSSRNLWHQGRAGDRNFCPSLRECLWPQCRVTVSRSSSSGLSHARFHVEISLVLMH